MRQNQDDVVEIGLIIARLKGKHKSASRRARYIDNKTVSVAIQADTASLTSAQLLSVVSVSSSSKPQDSNIVQRKDDTPSTSSVPTPVQLVTSGTRIFGKSSDPQSAPGSLDTSMSAENNQANKQRSNKRKPGSSPQQAFVIPPATASNRGVCKDFRLNPSIQRTSQVIYHQ